MILLKSEAIWPEYLITPLPTTRHRPPELRTSQDDKVLSHHPQSKSEDTAQLPTPPTVSPSPGSSALPQATIPATRHRPNTQCQGTIPTNPLPRQQGTASNNHSRLGSARTAAPRSAKHCLMTTTNLKEEVSVIHQRWKIPLTQSFIYRLKQAIRLFR